MRPQVVSLEAWRREGPSGQGQHEQMARKMLDCAQLCGAVGSGVMLQGEEELKPRDQVWPGRRHLAQPSACLIN